MKQIKGEEQIKQLFNLIKIFRILQSRVNLNLEYYYQKDFKKLKEDNQQVLDKISLELKNQLLKEYNRQIINKIDILIKKFSPQSLDELSLTLKEDYYFPNQVIFNPNTMDNTCIMFIVSGQGISLFINLSINQFFFFAQKIIYQYLKQIQNYLPLNKIKVEFVQEHNFSQQSKVVFKSGQICGLLQFFTGIPNEMCVISKEFTQIIRIERQDFIDIIKDKERDFQEFCQLRDELSLYKQYDKINLICKICDQKNHDINDCHFAHFNKEIYYRRQGYAVQKSQNRRGYLRKKYHKQFTFTIKSIQQKEQLFAHVRTLKNFDEDDFEDYSSSISFDQDVLLSPEKYNNTNNNNNTSNFNDNQSISLKSQTHISEQKVPKVLSSNYISKLECDSTLANNNYLEDRNLKKQQKFSLQNFQEPLVIIQFQKLSQIYSYLQINQQENQQDCIKNAQKLSDLSQIHITRIQSEQICGRTSDLTNNKSEIQKPHKQSIEISLNQIQELQQEKRRSYRENEREDNYPSDTLLKKRIIQKLEECGGNKGQIGKQYEDFKALLSNQKIKFTNNPNKRKSVQNQDNLMFNPFQNILLYRHSFQEEEKQQANPWLFESLKDYKYYFTKGNSYNVLKKLQRIKRKSRLQQRKSIRK